MGSGQRYGQRAWKLMRFDNTTVTTAPALGSQDRCLLPEPLNGLPCHWSSTRRLTGKDGGPSALGQVANASEQTG